VDVVTVDGATVPNPASSYTFNNVTANHSINVTFKKKTYTLTPSAGTGGTITPSTVVTVNHGGNQTFTFNPATGYEVDQVKVDGSSVSFTGNQYQFTNVTANHSINVTFKLKSYTLTPSAGTGGTITPSTVVTVNHGGSQTFTFNPATGYEVDQVKVDGSSVSFTGNQYQFTNVTANHSINVTFKLKSYTITATAGTGGTISPSGAVTVNHGDNQAFSFNVTSGYEVDVVTVDGSVVPSPGTSYTFTNVTANHTIHVTFKPTATPQFTIVASAGTGGTINPSGNVIVNQGTNQTFTFFPDVNYEVDKVKVDGVEVEVTDDSFTFLNVTSDHSINVTFKEKNAVGAFDALQPQVWYARGFIYVKNLIPGTSVQVFDVLGRKQKAEGRKGEGRKGEKEKGEEEKGEVVVDVSGLPVGVYFVKISTEKGVVVRKVVRY